MPRFMDSGAEIVLDSGGGWGEGEGELILSTAAEEAIIGHYEDFHLFMYGYIPLFIAVAIVIFGCIWFTKTFTRM